MKILVTINLKDKYLEMIEQVSTDIDICKELDLGKQKKEIVDADIMISGGGSNKELLRHAGQLDWIQTWSAGVEDYTRGEIVEVLKEKDIMVASMSGIHGGPIAEHVMGFIINYSRKLCKFFEEQKKSRWKKLRMGQLAGKTMVIAGVGSIGQEIARKAKAFDMKTIGVKRTVDHGLEYIDELYSNDKLLDLLKLGDYVVVTVPLTAETEGMFGSEEFKAMKETAFFVNIARGKVVVEEEIIAALEKGVIAGAGLDVFEEEPLPAESPLYRLENVYITPHVSGFHPDYNIKATSVFVENLKRYIAGKEIINLVDYSRGY